jgi:hypothetical protein
MGDQLSLADIGNMSWEDLFKMRDRYTADPFMQKLLAPFEHQAFARQYVQDNPMMGPLVMGTSIPLYQLAKFLRMQQGSRSGFDLDQLFAGYTGLFQGMGR